MKVSFKISHYQTVMERRCASSESVYLKLLILFCSFDHREDELLCLLINVLLQLVAFSGFRNNQLDHATVVYSIGFGFEFGFGCLFFIRIHSDRLDLVESFDKKSIFDLITASNR